MSRVRVLAVVAIAAAPVITFAWLVLTQPMRTTPIGMRDLAQLVFPTVVLIVTLAGWWVRRRASRETKPPS